MENNYYRFSVGDSLLCFHGPMLYEAKCLERRKTIDGKTQYYIHYKGWNRKWNDWVDEHQVLAANRANMKKMATLKAIHSHSKKGPTKQSSAAAIKEETVQNAQKNTTPTVKGRKRKFSEIPSEFNPVINILSPQEPKPKKRGRPPKMSIVSIDKIDESDETKEASKTEENDRTCRNKIMDNLLGMMNIFKFFNIAEPTEIPKITMPYIFAKILAQDYFYVKHYNKVLQFPKDYTVERLLRSYACSKINEERKNAVVLCVSFISFFNLLIHEKLLCLEELQFGLPKKATDHLNTKMESGSIEDLFSNISIPKNVYWHHIYNPIYLLRLLVIIPTHLCNIFVYLSNTCMKTFIYMIEDFFIDGALLMVRNLIQFFNLIIHEELLYPEEVQFGLPQKATDYLTTKMKSGSMEEYFPMDILTPKNVYWHNIYHPTYLL